MTHIRTDRTEDGVLEVVLCSPERGNAIDIPWADQLVAAAEGVADDDRCVLLRSEGRNFSVGGDVGTFLTDDTHASLSALADRLHDGLDLLDELPVPVVVAVQGWAAGAGMSLALWGDVIVAGEGARFRTAYNGLGVTADGGMTWQLPRRVPMTVAMDLLFSDRTLAATEALSLGLVARVVPDDELEQAARALAVEIAGKSTTATRVVKRLLRSSPRAERRPHLDAERDAIADAAVAPDGQEGISAFLEKRTPRFNR